MRGVAAQTRHSLSGVQRICGLGNRVSRAWMSEAQRGVKLDFRNRLEIGPRDSLDAEETYRICCNWSRQVALEAK